MDAAGNLPRGAAAQLRRGIRWAGRSRSTPRSAVDQRSITARSAPDDGVPVLDRRAEHAFERGHDVPMVGRGADALTHFQARAAGEGVEGERLLGDVARAAV